MTGVQTCALPIFICTQLAVLILMLQRKKVSPKGLTFARRAVVGTTSLAARSVALWLVAHRLALFIAILWHFCFRCFFSYLYVGWPVGLSFVITLFIIYNFWFVALFRFYVMNGIDA